MKSAMRIARVIALILLGCIAVIFLLLLIIPSNTVTSRYDRLQDARADGLFDRGWLPDVLPPTAFDIEVSNNLDLNMSAGEFSFDPAEYPLLLEKTRPYPTGGKAGGNRDGLEERLIENDGAIWVFRCSKSRGYCEYDMKHRQT